MKLGKYLLMVVMVLTTLTASAINEPQTIYMYGFAASYNDSTVYFTEIQSVDSAYIDSKTKFLYGRSDYSYQLRNYLDGIGFKDAVCITSFAPTLKKAEKKYLKLRKKYLEGGRYTIKYIKTSEFSYQPIKATEESKSSDTEASKEPKMSKKKAPEKPLPNNPNMDHGSRRNPSFPNR